VSDSPWAVDAGRRSRSQGGPRPGRVVEVVTVLLLALATVGSAWAAFQVARWNGVETDEARASGSFRIEAAREYALATQLVTYDAAAISQYAAAVASDNLPLEEFIRDTIMRPDFLPLLEQWSDQVQAGETPTNLLEDQSYLEDLFADSFASDVKAEDATVKSEEAGRNADDYIQLTLFFAAALFFAGVTASFNTRFARLVLLTGSAAVLVAAASLLAGYPVA
jgi:hypothetical protein